MRIFKWISRAIDWLLDKMWVLVVVLTVYGTLTACAPLSLRTVVYTPRVGNNINYLYSNIQVGNGKEFAYCVYGRVIGNTMLVTSIDLPTITESDSTWVRYISSPCDSRENMLGMGHSHPPGYACAFSDTDWSTFRSSVYLYSFLTCDNVLLRTYTRNQIPGAKDEKPTPTSAGDHPSGVSP